MATECCTFLGLIRKSIWNIFGKKNNRVLPSFTEFENQCFDVCVLFLFFYSLQMSDDDRLSLTTAVSDDDDCGAGGVDSETAGGGAASPFRKSAAAASFNCTGAVRKAGSVPFRFSFVFCVCVCFFLGFCVSFPNSKWSSPLPYCPCLSSECVVVDESVFFKPFSLICDNVPILVVGRDPHSWPPHGSWP